MSSDQLRHDLLNPLHVLGGATTGLLAGELTDAQRTWVRLIQSASSRLQQIVDDLDGYEAAPLLEGRARLADLCSIAAARVAKPFDRERLVTAIEAVAGRRPLRILLVDDSPDLVELVRAYLNETGWTLDTVENGERAVAQANAAQYDVVLMDIDLPGVDGATAAHAIRAADLARGISPTPIIAMTAFDPGPSAGAGPVDERPPESAWPSADSPPDFVVSIDDPEVAPLVPEFLALRRADVRTFRDALQSGAFAAIQATAHKIKGTGRGYGFTTISRLGGELEIAAHGQDVPVMTRLIDQLDDYLTRVTVINGTSGELVESRGTRAAFDDRR